MRQFHPTREAAVDYLIECGFDLTAGGEWRRGTRYAAPRQTRRGWALDLTHRQPAVLHCRAIRGVDNRAYPPAALCDPAKRTGLAPMSRYNRVTCPACLDWLRIIRG